MITKTTGYQTSDGTVHATLRNAQIREVKEILSAEGNLFNTDDGMELIASLIVDSDSKIIDILTTGPKSRPKARAVNGAKRSKKKRHEAEQFSLPLPTEGVAE